MTAYRHGSLGVAAAIVVMGIGIPAHGQFRDRRPEARGVVKSVDAGASTITLATPGPNRDSVQEKTYSIASDAEVVAGAAGAGRGAVFSEAKLGDLSPGLTVTLTLSLDEKTVEGLVVEEPVLRGIVKSIDPASKRITVVLGPGGRDQTPEEKSFTVPDAAEIAVDDGRGRRFSIREGRLADVVPGSQIAAWLSLDRQTAHALLAEGPGVLGTIKSYDPASRGLALTIRPPRGDDTGEERSVTLADNATILLDDGRGKRLSIRVGKPDDLKAGSTAQVRLSLDQGKATQLRVEGPTISALLKSTDAAKQTITITIPRGRGEAPEEKTIPVAKDARITSEGVDTTLAGLRPSENGPLLQLRMSLDQTTVQSIVARQFQR